MPSIKWKESYSVSVPKMDEQHKLLVSLLNDLHDYVKQNKADEIVTKTFSGLIEYIKTHFTEEEALMQEINYPKLEEHSKLHKKLIATTSELFQRHKSGETGIEFELLKFLKDWFIVHISKVDKNYGEFIKKQKATAAKSG